VGQGNLLLKDFLRALQLNHPVITVTVELSRRYGERGGEVAEQAAAESLQYIRRALAR
jgi:sugar phosphate isomerase/epimerase